MLQYNCILFYSGGCISKYPIVKHKEKDTTMMKKFSILVKILTLLLSITIGAAGCGKSDPIQQNEMTEQETCTLKEAWEIALSDAQQWSDDAEAILITSTDNHDIESPDNGMDGKRRCWSFMFHSEIKDNQYSVYVINGKAAHGQEAATSHFSTFTMDDVSLDSDDLYSLAQEYLKGGVDWAWGYHYILQYRYMDENGEEPQLTFSIRGLNDDGQERYAIYDPYSGELLVILDKTGYDSNGRSVWEITENHMEAPSGQQTESNDHYAGMSREELEENREQIEQEFSVYENSVKYRLDPEEFYNAVIDGLTSGRFSPFSNCISYEDEEEWRSKMEAYYGETWEEMGK